MGFFGPRGFPTSRWVTASFVCSLTGSTRFEASRPAVKDTPFFVTEAQLRVLQILSKEKDSRRLALLLSDVLTVLRERVSALDRRAVPLQQLLVTQVLSRELDQYRVPSPAARATSQLQATGRDIHMGQKIQFLYTQTKQGVWASDLPKPPSPSLVDTGRYKELLFRAVYEVLQPIGVTESVLRNWMFCNASYLLPAGLLHHRLEMPLFANLKYLTVD